MRRDPSVRTVTSRILVNVIVGIFQHKQPVGHKISFLDACSDTGMLEIPKTSKQLNIVCTIAYQMVHT